MKKQELSKQETFLDMIRRGETVANIKKYLSNFPITNINTAIDFIVWSSIFDYLKKQKKPEAYAYLDSCKECDSHTSSSGYTVMKVKSGPIYGSTKKIIELEESITRLEDKLKSKKAQLLALKKAAGIKKHTSHYWKIK